jgi:hypothetical protein
MYDIKLGDNLIRVEGDLGIYNNQEFPMPYITITKEKEIIFFAPLETITFVKKQ